MLGGWRIVKTMGQKITKLRPVGGFAAETGGAITLFLASSFGIPVSTTHTITGAIVGVGSAQRVSAVRWGLAGNIVIAWIVTMPAAALMAAIAVLRRQADPLKLRQHGSPAMAHAYPTCSLRSTSGSSRCAIAC